MRNKMTKYSPELQRTVINRMSAPTHQSVASLSNEFGIPQGTVYTWRSKAQARGELVLGDGASGSTTHSWSAQAKLAAVIETAALTEVELGEYCRAKGLHVAELAQWKATCLGSFTGQSDRDVQAQRANKEAQQKIHRLQRDLTRKDKALAESAALLVLSKKMQAIWAEVEDE